MAQSLQAEPSQPPLLTSPLHHGGGGEGRNPAFPGEGLLSQWWKQGGDGTHMNFSGPAGQGRAKLPLLSQNPEQVERNHVWLMLAGILKVISLIPIIHCGGTQVWEPSMLECKSDCTL